MTAFAKASNGFGLDVYGRVRSAAGNLAFGPASLSLAFAMTWAGARGETATQMSKVLHIDGALEPSWAESCGKVSSFLTSRGPVVEPAGAEPDKKPSSVELRVANRLFGDKAYSFEQPYLEQMKAAFSAPLVPVDFRTAFEPARKQINEWVSTETEKRIPELVPVNGVDSDTRLVLVNAMTFTGSWAEPFNAMGTEQAPFHLSKADTKNVATMSHTAVYRTAAVDGVTLVELPYFGGDVAMTVVMPDAVDGLEAVEKSLTVEGLGKWTGALGSERISLRLPKFTVAPAGAMALADPIKELGMKDAFDGAKADFTGMAKPASPADRLYIAKVFHRAFVKVDEKGTEAAAASAVVMSRVGSVAPAKPRELKVDRPFLFFVRDVPSGLVLFMGRVVDPAAA